MRESLNVESVDEAARKSRLRWLRHVIRMDENRFPKRMCFTETVGVRGRGRPRRRFLESVKCDLNERGYE